MSKNLSLHDKETVIGIVISLATFVVVVIVALLGITTLLELYAPVDQGAQTQPINEMVVDQALSIIEASQLTR